MELSDIWITRRDEVGTMKLAQYPYSDNCGKPNHISVLTITPVEALKLIRSLVGQLDEQNTNGVRLESKLIDNTYFTIGVKFPQTQKAIV